MLSECHPREGVRQLKQAIAHDWPGKKRRALAASSGALFTSLCEEDIAGTLQTTPTRRPTRRSCLSFKQRSRPSASVKLKREDKEMGGKKCAEDTGAACPLAPAACPKHPPMFPLPPSHAPTWKAGHCRPPSYSCAGTQSYSHRVI